MRISSREKVSTRGFVSEEDGWGEEDEDSDGLANVPTGRNAKFARKPQNKIRRTTEYFTIGLDSVISPNTNGSARMKTSTTEMEKMESPAERGLRSVLVPSHDHYLHKKEWTKQDGECNVYDCPSRQSLWRPYQPFAHGPDHYREQTNEQIAGKTVKAIARVRVCGVPSRRELSKIVTTFRVASPTNTRPRDIFTTAVMAAAILVTKCDWNC